MPDCCADAFQSQDVLEHLEPEKVVMCINEVFRVLKKRGIFRLSLPDYNSPLLKKDLYITGKVKYLEMYH